MHIFHKWSKWESYTEKGKVAYTGLLVPENERGVYFPYEEKRQKRTCEICGKKQDVKI